MLLSAARPLDEREWYVMREHSEIGERILRAAGRTRRRWNTTPRSNGSTPRATCSIPMRSRRWP
jgi:hypothetical protein